MVEAHGLLDAARYMLLDPAAAGVSEARCRRAVSTAYYAVFHHLMRTAADCFIGRAAEGTAGYGLMYRSLSHTRVVQVCKRLDVAKLSSTLQSQLRRTAVSVDMRSFAGDFVLLQELRELADYEPSDSGLTPSACQLVVETAHDATQALDRVAVGERTDVLALMFANPRA